MEVNSFFIKKNSLNNLLYLNSGIFTISFLCDQNNSALYLFLQSFILPFIMILLGDNNGKYYFTNFFSFLFIIELILFFSNSSAIYVFIVMIFVFFIQIVFFSNFSLNFSQINEKKQLYFQQKQIDKICQKIINDIKNDNELTINNTELNNKINFQDIDVKDNLKNNVENQIEECWEEIKIPQDQPIIKFQEFLPETNFKNSSILKNKKKAFIEESEDDDNVDFSKVEDYFSLPTTEVTPKNNKSNNVKFLFKNSKSIFYDSSDEEKSDTDSE